MRKSDREMTRNYLLKVMPIFSQNHGMKMQQTYDMPSQSFTKFYILLLAILLRLLITRIILVKCTLNIRGCYPLFHTLEGIKIQCSSHVIQPTCKSIFMYNCIPRNGNWTAWEAINNLLIQPFFMNMHGSSRWWPRPFTFMISTRN